MTKLERKPLDWFKTAPQARQHFDEEELRQLGESLKVKQLQPVLAMPDGLLIFGHRRLFAGRKQGLKELEVIITDEPLTESQVRIFQLTENVHRADLTDAEKWRACEELLRLNTGWTNKDLARHLKLAESTVFKYLAPSRCIPEVQAALEAGRVGITVCYEISRAAPDQQAELLRLAESGSSRDCIAGRVRRQRSQASPQVRAKRVLCPLASGVSVSVSGPDLSLDDLIEALAEAQKEARKARDQNLDVKTWQSVMRDKSRAG